MSGILQTIENDLSKIRVTVTPQDVSRIVDGALPPATQQAIAQKVSDVTGATHAENVALVVAGVLFAGLALLAVALSVKKK